MAALTPIMALPPHRLDLWGHALVHVDRPTRVLAIGGYGGGRKRRRRADVAVCTYDAGVGGGAGASDRHVMHCADAVVAGTAPAPRVRRA